MYKTLILITCLLFQLNMAHSEVYKWTDEHGRTIYGDKPGTEDADIIEIKKKTVQDNHHLERQKKQKKLLDVMQQERDEKIALKNKEKEELEKKEQQCEAIKKELQEIIEATLIYEKTDDPDNPRIYTDDERKKEIENLQLYMKDNC